MDCSTAFKNRPVLTQKREIEKMNNTNLSPEKRAELEAERQILYASVIKDFPSQDKQVMLEMMKVAVVNGVNGNRHKKILAALLKFAEEFNKLNELYGIK